MLLADNLNEQEQERVQMWELFAELLDFAPDFLFTAKDLAQATTHNKKDLNKLLYRLHKENALKMHQKTANGTFYSLNQAFLKGNI